MKDKKTYTIQDAINNPLGCIGRIIIWLFILLVVLVILGMFIKDDPTNNPNYINKSNFKGEWALTTDEAEIFCEKISNDMTGAKVRIKNKEYAITRNLETSFLSDTLWLNKSRDNFGVCDGVVLGDKCKVSLYDFVKYADKLCR